MNAARRSTMSYTLAEAATAVGMNKTSILRAIKSGRISGTRDELGQWHVEPVELHRVFPPVAEQRCTTDATQRTAAPDDAVWLAEANARTALHRLADLKAMLDEMRTERDAWRDQAQRLGLAAAAPSITLWAWLRSTGGALMGDASAGFVVMLAGAGMALMGVFLW